MSTFKSDSGLMEHEFYPKCSSRFKIEKMKRSKKAIFVLAYLKSRYKKIGACKDLGREQKDDKLS